MKSILPVNYNKLLRINKIDDCIKIQLHILIVIFNNTITIIVI